MYLKLTNVHKDTCIERYGGTLYNINVSIDVPVMEVLCIISMFPLMYQYSLLHCTVLLTPPSTKVSVDVRHEGEDP